MRLKFWVIFGEGPNSADPILNESWSDIKNRFSSGPINLIRPLPCLRRGALPFSLPISIGPSVPLPLLIWKRKSKLQKMWCWKEYNFILNSKHEIRNSKQAPMFKISMTQTNEEVLKFEI